MKMKLSGEQTVDYNQGKIVHPKGVGRDGFYIFNTCDLKIEIDIRKNLVTFNLSPYRTYYTTVEFFEKYRLSLFGNPHIMEVANDIAGWPAAYERWLMKTDPVDWYEHTLLNLEKNTLAIMNLKLDILAMEYEKGFR